MRKLEPHETPRTGDWFYVFGSVTESGWMQLDNKPMPFKRMTIHEADESNKHPHFPIVIMRPNIIERILGIMPKDKPNQHRMRRHGSAF